MDSNQDSNLRESEQSNKILTAHWFLAVASLVVISLLSPRFASAYIFGSNVIDEQWPVVQVEAVFLKAGVRIEDTARSCTASLVRSNVLLIAAHCLQSDGQLLEPKLRVRKGSQIQEATIKKVYVHPDAIKELIGRTIDADARNCNFPDVALIELRTALPFAIARIASSATIAPTSTFSIVGYGKKFEGQAYYGAGGERENPLSGGKKKFLKYLGTCLFVGGQGSSFKGDSGAPLFLESGVVALVSWGIWGQLIDGFPTEAYSRLDDASPTSLKMSTWLAQSLSGAAAALFSFPPEPIDRMR